MSNLDSNKMTDALLMSSPPDPILLTIKLVKSRVVPELVKPAKFDDLNKNQSVSVPVALKSAITSTPSLGVS